MFKRIVSVLVALILVMTSVSAFADENILGKKFRFEGDLFNVELIEPEGNHQFNEIDQFLFDLEDQLGYAPKFDINYDDQVVTVYLYQTLLEIPCLVDKLSNRVILPDVWPGQEIIEANELISFFDKEEYDLYGLNDENFKVLKAESTKENRPLWITVESQVPGEEGKTIELTTWDYEACPEKATFMIGRQGFIQLWYEVHGRY